MARPATKHQTRKQAPPPPPKVKSVYELIYERHQRTAGVQHELDRKWGGQGRLLRLVPADLAQRYQQQEALLAKEYHSDRPDPDKFNETAAATERGLAKLDEVATSSGAQPLGKDVWVMHIGSEAFDVCQTRDAASQHAAETGQVVFALEDFALMIETVGVHPVGQGIILETIKVIGKDISEPMKARPKAVEKSEGRATKATKAGLDDEIPF